MKPRRSHTKGKKRSNIQSKYVARQELIEVIQNVLGDRPLTGTWLGTPGPGEIATDYKNNERLFNPNIEWIIVEAFKNHAKSMGMELLRAKKRAKSLGRFHNIYFRSDEIFSRAIREIRSGKKVRIIDADLCKTLSTLVTDGLRGSIFEVCAAQKTINQDFFLPLTFSTRNEQDPGALDTVNSFVEQCGGKLVFERPYAGTMKIAMWYFKNAA